jgi:hypothetical protein
MLALAADFAASVLATSVIMLPGSAPGWTPGRESSNPASLARIDPAESISVPA